MKRLKAPPLLESLANTLHELTEEQKIKRKGTVFRGIARGVLWVDRLVNKQADRENQRRSSGSDSSQDSLELDDALTQASYDQDSQESEEKVGEDGDELDTEVVGTSWKKPNSKIRKVSYSKIDRGSQLRRFARDLMKVDTVFSSMVAISKESRRRKKEQIENEQVGEDYDSEDSDPQDG